MDTPANLVIYFLVLFVALGTLVICKDVSYQTEIIPNNNGWPELGSNKHKGNVNGATQNNFGQTGSTPWPLAQNKWIPNHSPSTGHQISSEIPRVYQPKSNGLVQDEELRSFSESLLQKDYNSPSRYTTVSYQGKTTSRSQNDEAPYPLLQVHQDAFKTPTIQKLLLLHDNYIPEATFAEQVTNQERGEEDDFLDRIMETQIMQFTKTFLVQKGAISNDLQQFKRILKEIWFTMYPRAGGKVGSSGFEHVFLGELKKGEVSGLHNWLYFNRAELKGEANYLGYMKKLEFGNGTILKLHFKFLGVDKPVASIFIGTSPELEIALYSTCFLLRPDRVCPLRLAGNNFIIRTYSFKYQGKSLIGSAFPEI